MRNVMYDIYIRGGYGGDRWWVVGTTYIPLANRVKKDFLKTGTPCKLLPCRNYVDTTGEKWNPGKW